MIRERLKEHTLGIEKYVLRYFLHVVLYWIALSFSYNAYKGIRRGPDHFAKYIGYELAYYLRYFLTHNPIPLWIRDIISSTIPKAVGLFAVIYLACLYYNRFRNLSYREWAFVLSVYALLANLIFFNIRTEFIIILNISIPVFIVILSISHPLIKTLSKILHILMDILDGRVVSFIERYRTFLISTIVAFLVYTFFSSFQFIPLYQNILLLMVFGLSISIYFIIGRGTDHYTDLWKVSVCYFLLAGCVFYPTATNIFRSDYWLIATLFDSHNTLSYDVLKKVVFFEMFGDLRFQPLGHLIMFLRHLVFGKEIVLYHLLNIVLHVAIALLIFSILSSLLKDVRYAFLFGLMFIVLPSQFDTVVWTYHIYIIVSTICVLLVIFFINRYSETGSYAYLAGAFTVLLISIYLYEAIILLPLLLVFLYVGLNHFKDRTVSVREIAIILCGIFLIYVLYTVSASYCLTLTQTNKRMSLSDLMSISLIMDGIGAVFNNLWISGIFKNIGIIPYIRIKDIVYVYLPGKLFAFIPLVKIAIAIVLLSLIRFSRRNVYLAVSLMVIALSYFFIISLGRLFTNDLTYVVSQPRYQYFPNTILTVTIGILLWRIYSDNARLRTIILTILFVVTFWNSQNVLFANNMVSRAMQSLDMHYYRIRDFLNKNPSAELFIDFIPDTFGKLYLGSSIALDIMFNGHITKHIKRASHIYNGTSFIENRNPHNESSTGSGQLQDFTIEWLYMASGDIDGKEIGIIGAEDIYPKIVIDTEGSINIIVRETETDEIHTYSLEHPYEPDNHIPYMGTYASMVVEKDGEWLCMIYNGILYDKQKLASTYKDWNGDGVKLLGEYYKGAEAVVFVERLFIQLDRNRYRCGNYNIGDRIGVDIKKSF